MTGLGGSILLFILFHCIWKCLAEIFPLGPRCRLAHRDGRDLILDAAPADA